jgi:hypothetical protein
VVVVGFAVTVAVLVELNPVEGLQLYDAAPLAVKVALCPLHIVGFAGLIAIVGNGFTVTTTV